ncbi:MAG: LysM domain-containing protein [Byssovorax sp.]
MADSYVVKDGDTPQGIAKDQGVSLLDLQSQNPGLAQSGVKPGDTVKLPPAQKKGDLTTPCQTCDCIIINLDKPFVIASAKDSAAKARTSGLRYTSPGDPDDAPMVLGQDATFEKGTAVPGGLPEVGTTAPVLTTQMDSLLGVFAGNDSAGNARKMFTTFQKPNAALTEYRDPKLDAQVEADENFKAFADRTLNGPRITASRRIHQALRAASWDINKVKRMDDLGILAFNSGAAKSNGLFVMIDGVQFAFVHVTKYHYDSCKAQYTIELEFHLYDVFGLDDEDVKTYGKGSPQGLKGLAPSVRTATTGISSWWQLQHQHAYAPMVTKMVVKYQRTVSTSAP